MAESLPYFLITANVVALENVSLVIHKVLRIFVNTLTVDEKHYLVNRDNLTEPIQVELSQKQKTFSEFSFAF